MARPIAIAAVLALACGAAQAVPLAQADKAQDGASAAEGDRVVIMRRYIVSAARIDKNPWRYASVPGFEVLSRAPDEETNWWLDALRRGQQLEDQVLPGEWLPPSPVPSTVIIDDTDLAAAESGQIHTSPIRFEAPADALTWGTLAGRPSIWNDHFEAHDQDTYAVNTNVFGVNTGNAACVIGLERVFRCAPPLPGWLTTGLVGRTCGLFRESFMPYLGYDPGELIRDADGPGTLWVSLERTRELLGEFKRDKKAKVDVPALGGLFSESPPSGAARLLWESEAALFVRWGLVGPGHDDPALARAFLEFVRRSRLQPVTERMFTECFGFGYGEMEARLASFLRVVLAVPTSVSLEMQSRYEEPALNEATTDQIGRILGDWLRMEGDSVRARDPLAGGEFLDAAGRMLERAYREDNGLPPDTAPVRGAGAPPPRPGPGPVVVMKPFVVRAERIHDPGLLAVYGLYEHDAGREAAARELLEAAVKAGVVRPRACLVLAELRYAAAISMPEGHNGGLAPRQTASVLEPLRIAMAYSPAPGAYGLLVTAWDHSEEGPGERDLEEVARGAALFPRIIPLAYHAALLCAKGGDRARAAELIDRGLAFATAGDSRKSFERLRAALASEAAPAGN